MISAALEEQKFRALLGFKTSLGNLVRLYLKMKSKTTLRDIIQY